MLQENFDTRLKRISDAIALREPDRVPCVPTFNTFPYLDAGYSMADVVYDAEKGKDAIRRYLKHYEPDMGCGYDNQFVGQGKILEKLGVNWLQWAGRPGKVIDDNSTHQYIEKPYLEDEDFPEFFSDNSGWMIRKLWPRTFSSLAPLGKLDFRGLHGWGAVPSTMQFADPAVLEAFKTLSEVGTMTIKYYTEYGMFNKEIEDMGFPQQVAATVTTAFDNYSDTLRGTIDSLTDLYERPEEVLRICEMKFPATLGAALGQASHSNGKFVFIPLHKGMDGFMSDKQYRMFYWDTLLRLVNGLIENGLTPLIYTEGKYTSRIECLMDLPKGKTWIHFEEVDLVKAKKLLGNVACLSGGMRSEILVSGTVNEVRDEVKRNLDVLAPGGGCIFDLADSMENCRRENVEAMFETVKTYGKY